MRACAGLEFEIEGAEHLRRDGPAVFVFNHQSKADVVIIATPWDACAPTAAEFEPRLKGKLVICMANALARVGDAWADALRDQPDLPLDDRGQPAGTPRQLCQ